MGNFVTFAECVNSPSSACLTSPGFLFPFVMFAVLVAVGAFSVRQDRTRYRRLVKTGLWAAAGVLFASFLAIGYFFIFDPDAALGVESSALSQTFWVVAISAFGGGVALLIGMLGYVLGGSVSQRLMKPDAALVIAIDGPAASGKGTLAKRIAAHFDLPCLDTGLLYRAVARDVMALGGNLEDAKTACDAARLLDATTLDDPSLRGPAVGDAASIVARIPAVRAALLDYQRSFAHQPRGAVLDGRDIGTVVCPDARVKIFVTATAEERARRRHLEHVGRGETIGYDEVLADIRRRDARDSGRDIAPMGAAADAIVLDTTHLNADQAFEAALVMVLQRSAKA
jgi:cytidylate kinase